MTDINILLVEDEQIVAKYIEKQLTGAGYRVLASITKGDEAIEKVKSLQPDVVLMDIKLVGDMDGIEAADFIRKNYQIPVIFLSSLTDDESFQRAKMAEPFGYLVKPIDIKEFNRVVEMALYKNRIYKEVLDAKQRFQIAIEAAKTRVWELWFDEDKLILDNGLPQLFGYNEKDIQNTPEERMNLVYEEDRELVLKAIKDCSEGKTKSFELEHRIYKKDGSIGWLLLRGVQILPANHKPARLIGSATDITERKNYEEELKKSEEKFRKVFENSGIGMVMVEPDGQFIKVNKAFCDITGYNEPEIIGKNFRDITHPDDLDISVGSTNELLEDISKETSTIEKRYFHKNGNLIWALTTLSLIRDPNGKPQFFITQIQDITNRKKYEEKLLRHTDELKILNASKDKFFSIISHDLRTPFNSLLGISEFIIQSYEEMSREEIKESISNIFRSSQKVYNLILNLFEWTRMQSGRFEVEKTPLNLSINVGEILNLYIQSAELKKIKLINNVSEEIYIVADKYMLETILRNLISNAIKFTNRGGNVSISAIRKGNFAEINVSDNGMGINEENQKKLFRIDTKFQTNGTADEAGTGLGLILCKEFVEENGGTIFVNSEEGKGASFFFTLPLQINS
ncbi:MAG: PAS domain S-box protein [Ignavibacteriaceae bacterium]|jgi:PAS domain S-box-containing protein|nr:PAS domain S-box protein [Ignavibacteriaceae bacterium]MCW8814276.1 PAS domain S-box protein [Chlorobium sp.]MCW9095476.1 PAS domain S-box protein [Ignavibacteriaceae bacterium]